MEYGIMNIEYGSQNTDNFCPGFPEYLALPSLWQGFSRERIKKTVLNMQNKANSNGSIQKTVVSRQYKFEKTKPISKTVKLA